MRQTILALLAIVAVTLNQVPVVPGYPTATNMAEISSDYPDTWSASMGKSGNNMKITYTAPGSLGSMVPGDQTATNMAEISSDYPDAWSASIRKSGNNIKITYTAPGSFTRIVQGDLRYAAEA